MTLIYVVFCLLNFYLIQAEVYPPVELHELIKALHDTCCQKIGVSEDEFKDFKLSDPSQKMKCYLHCILNQVNWVKPDGSLNYEYAVGDLHEKIRDIVLPTLEKCRDSAEGPDVCERAYNFNVCLYKHDPPHWVLP